MEIKSAKNIEDSETIRAANRSEKLALVILAGSVLAPVIWFCVPEQVKSKMTPILGIAGIGVATAFHRGAIKIQNGRMAVGDLQSIVQNYALLPAGETKLLSVVKPFVEGTLKLQELPEVRSLIDSAVKDATKPKNSPVPTVDMNEKVRQMAMMPTPIPEGKAVASPIVIGGLPPSLGDGKDNLQPERYLA